MLIIKENRSSHLGFKEAGQFGRKKNQFHVKSANDVTVITALNVLFLPHTNNLQMGHITVCI